MERLNTIIPDSFVVGQVKIVATGTPVQFPANSLANGIMITANSANAASMVLGNSGVANLADGTGIGYVLAPGSSAPIPISNSKYVFVNGTAGDILSFIGN